MASRTRKKKVSIVVGHVRPAPSRDSPTPKNFDLYPSWGPDGAYTFGGTCAKDGLVDGWVLSDAADSLFNRASGYYATIPNG